MPTLEWDPRLPVHEQLAAWCRLIDAPGVVHAIFGGGGSTGRVSWRRLEAWTRSRAVTVAEVRDDLGPPALDVALCSDLVYLRRGVELRPGPGEPGAGLVWSLGRAGRAALARGLLDPAPLPAEEAVALGLAQRVLEPDEGVPLAAGGSLTALTIARDLARSSVRREGAGLRLELASFRLLFASGDPEEGARAFLERRPPDFG